MKNLFKLLLIAVLCFAMSTTVFATVGDFTVTVTTPDGGGDVADKVSDVLGIVRWIGFIVAIVMVMYVGVKYLTAGAGQKAEVKSTMVPMLVGAAMVGLAPTLVNWIWDIFKTGN